MLAIKQGGTLFFATLKPSFQKTSSPIGVKRAKSVSGTAEKRVDQTKAQAFETVTFM